MKLKYILVIVVAVIIGLGWFWLNRQAGINKGFGSRPAKSYSYEKISSPKAPDKQKQPARFCPKPGILVKNGSKWSTPDGKWTHYTSSSASKIMSFQGAQWVGIKIGKVICLYKTDEAVSFPVALEYTSVQKVIEPSGGGWSGLAGNRKFCKSANIVDCPYFVEAPKDMSNIYEDIQYAPTGEDY